MCHGRLVVFRGTFVVLITATLFVKFPLIGSNMDSIELDPIEIADWALRFGKSLEEGCSKATSLRTIRDNFLNLGATVEWINATRMVEDIQVDVRNLLSWRKAAVETIADVAEYHASIHQYDKNIKHEYYKSEVEKDDDDAVEAVKNVSNNVKSHRPHKSIKYLDLSPHRNFANAPVYFGESSVHIPTNVYDRESDVLNAIKWSEHLTDAFISNLKFDPSLNWQYFGSSSGFLRVFPATTWVTEGKEKPDFYDCRTRPWYVEAAASPKDIVILVDGSGSMTGIRKEIAKNVIKDILHTLSEDDFVNVLRFSDVTEPVVECFEDFLVQANEENIRKFMQDMKQMKTENIANFTLGLITAFELLSRYNKSELGSQCNQAIMLITDGAPNTYQDIFRQYNYPNLCVRVFTYLIGKEVTEYQEVNWMACHNKGIFTHVATLPEVREQVQKYVPVMSRPMILSATWKSVIWTSVYADVPATELTVYEWKDREHERIRHRLNDMRRRMWFSAKEDPDIEHLIDTTPEPERETREIRPLQLVTTVAKPVFDRRNPKTFGLLGVAGTDVPTKEIIKYTKAYKIGVNAYAFAITNNGYILFHPEHRPLYHDLLRPGYRHIDLTQVELPDVDSELYEQDETLLKIRKDMIDRKNGTRKMAVRIPMDNFKRVVTRNNSYFYGPIYDTPFSLAVSLPVPYGRYRVVGYVDVKNVSNSNDWSQYFSGENWRVHPEWVYCEIPKKRGDGYLSSEDAIKIFLSGSLATKNFTWRTTDQPPKSSNPLCEKDLIQSLLFDAKATFVDPPKSEDEVIKTFGIENTFVATRSGLTRYEDYRPISEMDNSTERPIYATHTKATEEEFYKRAVDFYRINSSAFVFSVPFNAGDELTTLVTGSHALFIGNGTKKASAAVVGLQFNHSVFADRFFETTSECRLTSCRFKCDDEELDCFLLDNNGFIVVSENRDYTGKFFGEIDYKLFESMIESGIYKRVHVYDYQAVCLEEDPSHGFSPILLTPFHHLRNIFTWFWSKLALLYIHLSMYEWWSKDCIVTASDYDYDEYGPLGKTIPHTCEIELDLYEMLPLDFVEPIKGSLPMCSSSGCDKKFIVQPVPYTNLLMLVVYTTCPCETTYVSLKPREVAQNETLKCLRMRENVYRQRPRSVCAGCTPKETEMNHECSGCSRLSAVTVSTLLVTFITYHILTWNFLLV